MHKASKDLNSNISTKRGKIYTTSYAIIHITTDMTGGVLLHCFIIALRMDKGGTEV